MTLVRYVAIGFNVHGCGGGTLIYPLNIEIPSTRESETLQPDVDEVVPPEPRSG